MPRWKWLVLGAALCAAVISCHGGKEKKAGEKAPTAAYKPSPVPYVVGKLEVEREAAEPSVHLSVAVDAATSPRDIERLLNYFDKERYADFDIVWVDVYFDAAAAQTPGANAESRVATLRVNRPGFRELKLSDDLAEGELAGAQPEVTSQTEETMYLGQRGRMFDSAKQAQAMLNMMEDKPGHAVYRIVWQAPDEMELTYSVGQKMLVRVRSGVSRETWNDMTVDDLNRAARGAGFGGRRRRGGGYNYLTETGASAEPPPR